LEPQRPDRPSGHRPRHRPRHQLLQGRHHQGPARGLERRRFFSATSEPDAYRSYYSLNNGTSKHDIAKEKFFVSVTKAF
jgi:hypothetical protein